MDCIALTNENFKATIDKGVTAVNFWATWSAPCTALTPVVESLAKDFKGRSIVGKVNTDRSPRLAKKYDIQMIPTIIFFKDGEEVERVTGNHSKETLSEKINNYLETLETLE